MIQQFHFWLYTYSKELKAGAPAYTCTSMLFTRVNNGSIIHHSQDLEATPVSTDRWLNTVWPIHTME